MTAKNLPPEIPPPAQQPLPPSCAGLSQVPGAGACARKRASPEAAADAAGAAPSALASPLSPGRTAPRAANTVNELSGFKLTCAADDCKAGPEDGTVRTVGGERWFLCRNGHLNAELLDDFREAA